MGHRALPHPTRRTIEGLHASAGGARIDFTGDDRVVTDGPFTETEELIAGFWIIQASSQPEAVERGWRQDQEARNR